MKIIFDKKLEEPPPADRLWVMIKALESGAEIDALLRAEIIDALNRHLVKRSHDDERHQRGRTTSHFTFSAAVLAKTLINDHGVTRVSSACNAAVDSFRELFKIDSKQLTYGAVERTYRKIKDSADDSMTSATGTKTVSGLISGQIVTNALSRVHKSARSGNK